MIISANPTDTNLPMTECSMRFVSVSGKEVDPIRIHHHLSQDWVRACTPVVMASR
jgi:hypothetical protein